MIATEIKNDNATVRIHDTFCNNVSQESISRVNQIVSNSYKRRTLEENSLQTVKEEARKLQ